jgi:hypothetical protein
MPARWFVPVRHVARWRRGVHSGGATAGFCASVDTLEKKYNVGGRSAAIIDSPRPAAAR